MSKWAAGESDSEDEVTGPEPTRSSDALDALISEPNDGGANELIGLLMHVNFSTTKDQVAQFIRDANLKLKKVEMVQDWKTGEFSGRAKVFLEDQASLDEFLKLNGAPLNGKDVIAKVYEDRSPRRDEYRERGGGRYGGRREGGGGFSGGRSGDAREHGRGGDRGDRFGLNKSTSRDSRDDRRYGGDRDRERGPGDVRKSHSRDYDGPPSAGRPGGPRRYNSKDQSDKDPAIPEEPDTTPKERPKVVIAPRTLPIETIGKTDKTSDIFGGGKPHDEFQYEEKKRQQQQQQVKEQPQTAEKEAVKEEAAPAPPVTNKTEESSSSAPTNPPVPPKAGEEEGGGVKGGEDNKKTSSSSQQQHRSPRNGSDRPGGRGSGSNTSNNSKRYENDNNNKTFSKSRSRDETTTTSAPAGEVTPEGVTKGEEEGDKEGSRPKSYRQGGRGSGGRGGRGGEEREGGGRFSDRPKRTFKKEKSVEAEQPEVKAPAESSGKGTVDAEGFEEFTKGKSKGGQKNTTSAAAAPSSTATNTTTTATTPKNVPKKNGFAGLESDSD